MLFFLI
jgi:hypothetical protein